MKMTQPLRTKTKLTAAASLGLAGAIAMAPAAMAEPEAYEFDKAHTAISATWNHHGYSEQSIYFTDYDGTLMLDMDAPENSSIELTFNLADGGFWVGTPEDDKFEGHLASGDLFSLADFPTATFTSTSFETEDGETGTMTGDLTIKDTTHPVTLDVTLNKVGDAQGRKKAGFSASGTMMRSNWGMGYATPAVSDELELAIETELLGPEVAE